MEAWRHEQGELEWTPEWVSCKGNMDELATLLAAGKLRIVSDGSYKKKMGTAATIVTSQNLRHSIRIECQTPGRSEDQSAYRSELAGIMCGL